MGVRIHPVDARDAQVAEGLVAEYLDDVDGWRDCVRGAPHLAWWAIGPDLVREQLKERSPATGPGRT